MNAKARTARQILKARRDANAKRSISTHVAKATADRAARKAVTAALRKSAKTLREAGQLGKVQTRVCYVTASVVGPNYRYNAAQVARIAAAYKPRKAEYKMVRETLLSV
jgi:hypothetical protein